MRFNAALARRVALILGLSFPTFCNALADGRAVLPPKWMVEAYLSDALVKPSRDDIARAIIPGLGMVPGFLSRLVAVTWNPADLSNITLSNANLTATSSASGVNVGVRGTVAPSAGKLYCEFTITQISGSVSVGLAPTGLSLSANVTPGGNGGNDGASYRSLGVIYYNGSLAGTSPATFTTGDNIGMAVDFSNTLIYFAKNGSWQSGSNPAANTGGFNYTTAGLFPIFKTQGSSVVSGDNITVNFGATAFTYSPPSGFTSWV